MTGSDNDRILRAAAPIATTIRLAFWLVAMLAALTGTLRPGTGLAQEPQLPASTNEISTAKTSELESFVWDFGRSTDPEFNDEPQGWKRVTGTGYPSYIEGKIVPRDLAFSQSIRKLDLAAIAAWTRLRPSLNSVLDRQGIELPPFPPSISDMVVDRYFRVQLDGGQFSIESPMIPASRLYQYRFSCDITTRGLRRDTARAEFVFLTDDGVKVQRGKEIPQYKELATYSTARITGNTEWRRLSLDLIRPPQTATKMLVRLHVEQSEDGQQDISGTIGFDNVRIDQYPQLQLATNEPLGVYKTGSPIVATAKIMGLSRDASRVRFDLVDQAEELVASSELEVLHQTKRKDRNKSESDLADEFDSEVSWPLPRLQPGFYRINARLVGTNSETLSTETTVAVIDALVEGPARGCAGCTLPQGNSGIRAKERARWAGSLGVAWI
ncbi:MAG: hypothetical protein AB8B91_24315, partial [Rubripirellula sp.]